MEISIDRSFKTNEELEVYREKIMDFITKSMDSGKYMILAAYNPDKETNQDALSVLNVGCIGAHKTLEAMSSLLHALCYRGENNKWKSRKKMRRGIKAIKDGVRNIESDYQESINKA